MSNRDDVQFGTLKGKTITEIRGSVGDEAICISTSDGEVYRMYHDQSCCEQVSVEDIVGDLKDLLGSEVLRAEETSNSYEIEGGGETWTFYKLSTLKGSVTIRWYGSSNGYYSESVYFERI